MQIALIFGICVLALIVAFLLIKNVLSKDTGTPTMQEISNAIKEGAEAFLRRQNKTILLLAVILAAVVFLLYQIQKPELALWATVSFILGALCSVASGYIGMWISIRANIRTAAQATVSLNGALQTALRAGGVSGLFVVSLSLLGVIGLFVLARAIGGFDDITRIPLFIAGYGFGASFVALFAQLGGGIYTKAADVGADLVGKVEAGIPEDDPRNPAVIADLVGDNVGDCAGRGADLFESTAAENIGATILAALLYNANADLFGSNPDIILGVLLFPLVANALGLIASIIGIMIVKTDGKEDPMSALNRGYYVTAFLAVLGTGAAAYWTFGTGAVATAAPDAWWHFFLCGIIGVITSVAFLWITQYYTEYKYSPVQSIVEGCKTGPATNIISGIGVGLECVLYPSIVISIAVISSYMLGASSGLEGAGFFGTAVATMGMLGPCGYVLAMDTFGPITDNAGGIVEMSQQPEEVRIITDKLDAVGNTTKALTKGYAVGSAALAAFLLFAAFIVELQEYGLNLNSVDISQPAVFVGALMGAMLVFLFSSMAIKAVSKAAQAVISNVRDQFRAKPGILQGTDKPDYAQCVDIVTKASLREMVKPGLLVLLVPVAVGVIFRMIFWSTVNGNSTLAPLGDTFHNATTPGAKLQAMDQILTTAANLTPSVNLVPGAEVIAAMLLVGTITGVLMALFLNNSGGAWDNAKKFIELEEKDPSRNLGKGSDRHKAGVVGDTVGDPFKDTAGPSLHVLIKLLSTITLVLAPLFI